MVNNKKKKVTVLDRAYKFYTPRSARRQHKYDKERCNSLMRENDKKEIRKELEDYEREFCC